MQPKYNIVTELSERLASMGVANGNDARAWERIIVVRNQTRVPAQLGTAPFGFKFLVLSESGRPEWFGRYGWAHEEQMKRECALVAAITADKEASVFMPESRVLYDGAHTIQLSRFLGNTTYERTLPLQSIEQWESDLLQILFSVERFTSRITVLAGDGLLTGNTIPERMEVLASDCDQLAGSGVDERLVKRLRLQLEPIASLPVALQHGDLWPANILKVNGNWKFIDLTECGIVWVPGYDLFHLLNHGPNGFSTQWLAPERAAQQAPENIVRYRVIREFVKRNELDEQVVGLMALFFLVHISAYRLRPGVPAIFSAPWVAELERIDAALDSGLPLSELAPCFAV